jgi:hypothetical protein
MHTRNIQATALLRSREFRLCLPFGDGFPLQRSLRLSRSILHPLASAPTLFALTVAADVGGFRLAVAITCLAFVAFLTHAVLAELGTYFDIKTIVGIADGAIVCLAVVEASPFISASTSCNAATPSVELVGWLRAVGVLICGGTAIHNILDIGVSSSITIVSPFEAAELPRQTLLDALEVLALYSSNASKHVSAHKLFIWSAESHGHKWLVVAKAPGKRVPFSLLN